MRAAPEKADQPGEIVPDPDAPHAFVADDRPGDRKERAEDGWKRLPAWFQTDGVARPAGVRPEVPAGCFSLAPDVAQRSDDGYLNATAMCQANGKKWTDYWRLDGTKEFIQALAESTGIPADSLVETQSGRGGGTDVHPDVADHLAPWCSPRFAVQVANWMRTRVRSTGQRALAGPGRTGDPPVATPPDGTALDCLRRRGQPWSDGRPLAARG